MAKTKMKRNMFGSLYKPYKRVPKATKAYVKKAVAKDHEKGFVNYYNAGYPEPASDTSVFVPITAGIDDAAVEGASGSCNGLDVKYTRIVGTIRMTNSNAGADARAVRILLVYDRQTNAALPITGTLLDGNAPTNVSQSQFIFNYKTRYHVLMDRRTLIGGNTGVSSVPNVRDIHINKKLKLPKTMAVPAGFDGAITGFQKGALYLLILGDTTAANTDIATLVNLRTYYDM